MARGSTLPLDQDGSGRFLSWLIGFMVFLAALATGVGFAIDTALIRFDDGLRGTLTVELPQPFAGGPLGSASVDKALQLLRATSGITTATALDLEQEAGLLQPWLGDSVEAGQLPLPVLIDVQRTEAIPLDMADLGRRLSAIVPGASVETHGAWLEQLFRVAGLIEIGAAIIIALIGTAAVLTVIFTTRTGLMIHAPIVDLLHVMGATDAYIAGQFQWHAFRLGVRGGIIGLIPALLAFGALALAAQHSAAAGADLAPGLNLPVLAWVVVASLPRHGAGRADDGTGDGAAHPGAHAVSGRRRWLGRLAAALVLAWLGGLVWFIHGVEQPVAEPDTITDAVVVLTGGSLRVDNGLSLLAEGKARKLFVSGVHHGVDTSDMLRLVPNAPAWLECCIVLGHAADNTQGNALETAQWLHTEGFHSIRLVTANYHMQRALLEFTRALPPDIRIIAHPVFPDGTRPLDLWSLRSAARLIVIEYTKYIGALARPLLSSSVALPGPK